jgi:hypothetical protein
MGDHARNGRTEATEILHRFIHELGHKKPARGSRSKRAKRPAGSSGDERVPAGV